MSPSTTTCSPNSPSPSSSTLFPPRPPSSTRSKAIELLQKCISLADQAVLEGHHPFAAILVSPDGQVVLEQGNVDSLNHAELTLARRAYEKYTPAELWTMTLVTNFEPCLMCSGAIYWANIGTVIYGSPESVLQSLTGPDHPENPTLSQPCRETFDKGSKDIRVMGPIEELEHEVTRAHKKFWEATE